MEKKIDIFLSGVNVLLSPVLEQGVLGDLVVCHWLPERVNLLEDELSDL